LKTKPRSGAQTLKILARTQDEQSVPRNQGRASPQPEDAGAKGRDGDMETATQRPLWLRTFLGFWHPAEPPLHHPPCCDRIGSPVDFHIIPPHHRAPRPMSCFPEGMVDFSSLVWQFNQNSNANFRNSNTFRTDRGRVEDSGGEFVFRCKNR
jgi:hypothetical protein